MSPFVLLLLGSLAIGSPAYGSMATGSAALAGAADGAREIIPVPRSAQDLDERIEFVSTAIDEDEEAAALGWRPNERCEDQELLNQARARFRELVAERRDWLAERRGRVDRRLDHDVVHVRTRHFDVSFDMDEIKANRRTLRGVDAALLYAGRIEDYHDHVVRSLRIDPSRMTREGRHEVFLLGDRDSAEKLTTELLGNKLGTGWVSNRIGYPISAIVFWNNREYIKSDEDRHQRLVHSLAHLVYHDVGLYRNWLYDDYGWLYEGLAFRDEIALFGPPLCSCDPDDALDLKHWLSEYWEANIRKALKQRRDPDPARVFGWSVEDLNPKDRQFAWSYVDFLIWYDPAKMADLLEKTKGETMSTVDALQATYGMDLPTFQERWREFVAEQYTSKARKGPTPPRSPRDDG